MYECMTANEKYFLVFYNIILSNIFFYLVNKKKCPT